MILKEAEQILNLHSFDNIEDALEQSIFPIKTFLHTAPILHKTFLAKLLEHNEKEEQRYQTYLRATKLLNQTIEKYKTLYPTATVTGGRDYAKYLGSFDVVKVEFESGSYIEFRIDTFHDADIVFRKKDVEYEKLSPEELLERFSKQVKKEGSN